MRGEDTPPTFCDRLSLKIVLVLVLILLLVLGIENKEPDGENENEAENENEWQRPNQRGEGAPPTFQFPYVTVRALATPAAVTGWPFTRIEG